MKIVILVLALGFMLSSEAQAAQRVRTHIRKSGKIVLPHYRSHRDSYKFNNWSTKGNVNPYTGKKGARSPYKNKRIHLY